jgi:hypothetical protein
VRSINALGVFDTAGKVVDNSTVDALGVCETVGKVGDKSLTNSKSIRSRVDIPRSREE